MATKSASAEQLTVDEIVAQLKTMGSDSYKKVMLKHGAQEPIYGVKIEDLKKIQQRVKTNHQLALDLYDTGISEAMYLAGLIADDQRMTKKDLQKWLKKASWKMLSEYTVPWVAAGSKHGYELALEWIDSKDETTAAAGWSTLAGIVALKDDEDLDLRQFKQLIARVQKSIHDAPDRVRYVMNSFIIAVASFVQPLTEIAYKAAEKIGTVSVDMGDTACKVPYAPDYIRKVQERGTIGKKRKAIKC